jgi:hypothetical protein
MANEIAVWQAKQAETASVSSQMELSAVIETVNSLKANNSFLAEELENISMMLDERGYTPIFEQGRTGLTLYQIYLASRQLRELLIGNPTVKSGSQKRNAYIWGKGVNIELTMKTAAAKARIQTLMLLPANQQAIFSAEAQERLERAAYTEGNVFFIGEENSKKLITVPLFQINGHYADPDNHDDIWAIRRTWTRMMGTESQLMSEWYWLNTYDGRRATQIPINDGQAENVNTRKTAIVKRYNRQIGWTWGIPDALPIIAWARLWRDLLIDGSVMQSALAKIAFKATAKTAAGRDRAAAVMDADAGPARTASMTDTMDLVPLATAGKGYDFTSGEPLAAQIAIGLDLAVDELLGANSTEDKINTTTKRAMRMRQAAQGELLREVITWLGAPAPSVEIEFPEIDDQDTYRRFAQLGQAWGTGLFAPEEIREEMAEVGEIELTGTMPSDVLTPNTASSIDAGATTTTTNADGSTVTVNKQGGKGGAAPNDVGVKPDGSNSQSNGRGRDSVKTGKNSSGDNGLRDGTTKA